MLLLCRSTACRAETYKHEGALAQVLRSLAKDEAEPGSTKMEAAFTSCTPHRKRPGFGSVHDKSKNANL